LRIGGKVRFCEGFFETRDPELMALVERNELYGAQILQIDMKKGAGINQSTSCEQA
jgi:hypothetical protein